MTDLKPCPFCGGEAALGNKHIWRAVVCKSCDISMATIAGWNTRAIDPAAIRKEALREAVRVHHQGVGAILGLIDKGAE